MIFLGMKKKHLMVIDPAVEKPAIESFNRLSIRAPYPTSYHKSYESMLQERKAINFAKDTNSIFL